MSLDDNHYLQKPYISYNDYSNNFNSQTMNHSTHQYNKNPNFLFSRSIPNVIQQNHNQMQSFSELNNFQLGKDGPFSRTVMRDNFKSSNYYHKPTNYGYDNFDEQQHFQNMNLNNDNNYNNNNTNNHNNSHINPTISTTMVREKDNLKSSSDKLVQNYNDMNDEELARHCYVLAKDQGGCRFLQKKAEDSKEFTNVYLFPNVFYV